MKAIYAKDFNGNESQQDYQLETMEEKIARLRLEGYKEVWIADEYDGESETIPLNNINNKLLYKVTYTYDENVTAKGKVKVKHRVASIYIYADNTEKISKRTDICENYACRKPKNLSIVSIEAADSMEKGMPCLVC